MGDLIEDINTVFCEGPSTLNSGNEFVDLCHQLLVSSLQKSFVRLPKVIRLRLNSGDFDYEEQKEKGTGGGASIVAPFSFN